MCTDFRVVVRRATINLGLIGIRKNGEARAGVHLGQTGNNNGYHHHACSFCLISCLADFREFLLRFDPTSNLIPSSACPPDPDPLSTLFSSSCCNAIGCPVMCKGSYSTVGSTSALILCKYFYGYPQGTSVKTLFRVAEELEVHLLIYKLYV